MKLVKFELIKLKRRVVLVIVVLTLIVFPILLKTFSHLDYLEGKTPEGSFVEQNQLYIIQYATLYLFIPVWIIIIIGSEFKNGFAQRILFYKSRSFYFKSKIAWCVIVTSVYSLLCVLTLWLCLSTVKYQFAYTNFTFYSLFGIQCFITFLLHTLVLMCLVLIIRDIVISLVIYYLWQLVESIVVMLFDRLYHIKLYLLPFQLHTVFYLKMDGRKQTLTSIFQYSQENIFSFLMVMLLVALTFFHFNRINLKPLSD
jgi:hypothetical protein